MAVTLRIEPRWTDYDPAGHVNNSVYLVYAEEARARYLRAALPGTWEMVVVVNNAIDYHSPVEADETVDVTSGVESVGRSSCTSVSVIRDDGRTPVRHGADRPGRTPPGSQGHPAMDGR